MNDCIFYCIDAKTPESKEVMEKRFERLSVSFEFCVEKCFNAEDCNRSVFRSFLSTSKEFAVVCKGGVKVHRDLIRDLESILLTVKSLDLEFLHLGYDIEETIEPWSKRFHLLTQMGERRYHHFPQTFGDPLIVIVSRPYALNYLSNPLHTTHKRALVYPPYGVPENLTALEVFSFPNKCSFCDYFPGQFY